MSPEASNDSLAIVSALVNFVSIRMSDIAEYVGPERIPGPTIIKSNSSCTNKLSSSSIELAWVMLAPTRLYFSGAQ